MPDWYEEAIMGRGSDPYPVYAPGVCVHGEDPAICDAGACDEGWDY